MVVWMADEQLKKQHLEKEEKWSKHQKQQRQQEKRERYGARKTQKEEAVKCGWCSKKPPSKGFYGCCSQKCRDQAKKAKKSGGESGGSDSEGGDEGSGDERSKKSRRMRQRKERVDYSKSSRESSRAMVTTGNASDGDDSKSQKPTQKDVPMCNRCNAEPRVRGLYGFCSQKCRETKRRPKDLHNDQCDVCGLGGNLLCCDACICVFHLGCASLTAEPEGEWFCEYCCKDPSVKTGSSTGEPGKTQELSEYEKLRQRNIQRNEAQLRSLGLLPPPQGSSAASSSGGESARATDGTTDGKVGSDNEEDEWTPDPESAVTGKKKSGKRRRNEGEAEETEEKKGKKKKGKEKKGKKKGKGVKKAKRGKKGKVKKGKVKKGSLFRTFSQSKVSVSELEELPDHQDGKGLKGKLCKFEGKVVRIVKSFRKGHKFNIEWDEPKHLADQRCAEEERRVELQSLKEEADIPLKQILAAYTANSGSSSKNDSKSSKKKRKASKMKVSAFDGSTRGTWANLELTDAKSAGVEKKVQSAPGKMSKYYGVPQGALVKAAKGRTSSDRKRKRERAGGAVDGVGGDEEAQEEQEQYGEEDGNEEEEEERQARQLLLRQQWEQEQEQLARAGVATREAAMCKQCKTNPKQPGSLLGVFGFCSQQCKEQARVAKIARCNLCKTKPKTQGFYGFCSAECREAQKQNRKNAGTGGGVRPIKNAAAKGSQYFGVTWNIAENRWKAMIVLGGKKRSLGLFEKEIAAAKAYDQALRHFRSSAVGLIGEDKKKLTTKLQFNFPHCNGTGTNEEEGEEGGEEEGGEGGKEGEEGAEEGAEEGVEDKEGVDGEEGGEGEKEEGKKGDGMEEEKKEEKKKKEKKTKKEKKKEKKAGGEEEREELENEVEEEEEEVKDGAAEKAQEEVKEKGEGGDEGAARPQQKMQQDDEGGEDEVEVVEDAGVTDPFDELEDKGTGIFV
jgi:hypothetical protein